MNVGDFCYRDKKGVAHLSLPDRIRLLDGSTRTDSSQWIKDPAIREETGWSESVLTQEDIDILFPTPPEPEIPEDMVWLVSGYDTGMGWKLGWFPQDVALLTGLYVLAKRSAELNMEVPIVVTDTEGNSHSLSFEEFETLMLDYGHKRMLAST